MYRIKKSIPRYARGLQQSRYIDPIGAILAQTDRGGGAGSLSRTAILPFVLHRCRKRASHDLRKIRPIAPTLPPRHLPAAAHSRCGTASCRNRPAEAAPHCSTASCGTSFAAALPAAASFLFQHRRLLQPPCCSDPLVLKTKISPFLQLFFDWQSSPTRKRRKKASQQLICCTFEPISVFKEISAAPNRKKVAERARFLFLRFRNGTIGFSAMKQREQLARKGNAGD